MAVAVFNDRYSPNVGDGLLAACLERELARTLSGEAVHTIDLDGKTAFPPKEAGAAARSATPRRLAGALLPLRIKHEIAARAVDRRLRRAIRRAGEPRIFVVGGGHLVNGSGTYFPLRLRALARIARDCGAGLFVQSVGVTDPATWQSAAGRWLRETFDSNPDLQFVSVRDPLSAHHWSKAFPNSPDPAICPDPGLLSRATFGVRRAGCDGAPKIGVGVIARGVARRLASGPDAVHATRQFYVGLCRSLLRRGTQPYLFTNGDPEDEAELAGVFEAVQADQELRNTVRKCPRPFDERSLVATIARFNGLVAHRMHATVAAYSLGIPGVGLAWDRKLESFFRLVRRERYFIADAAATPTLVADRVVEGVRLGIVEDERREAVQAAEEGVRILADRVRQTKGALA